VIEVVYDRMMCPLRVCVCVCVCVCTALHNGDEQSSGVSAGRGVCVVCWIRLGCDE